MSVPFVLRSAPYAAKASLRPPSAAPVALLARMMCSPRARSSLVRRSAAALLVTSAAGDVPGVAAGAIDIWSDIAGAGVVVAPVGALVATAPAQPTATTAVNATAVSMEKRDCTGTSRDCWPGSVVAGLTLATQRPDGRTTISPPFRLLQRFGPIEI